MINIGIISNYKDYIFIKRILINILKEKVDLNIESIDEKYLINCDISNFDIIYIVNIKYIKEYIEKVKLIFYRTKTIILNADLNENLRRIKNMKLNVITCGYSNKSTITVSSVSEHDIIIYLQRIILNINNEPIEPREIKVYFKKINSYYNIKYLEKSNKYIGKKRASNFKSEEYNRIIQEKYINNINLILGVISILILFGKKF